MGTEIQPCIDSSGYLGYANINEARYPVVVIMHVAGWPIDYATTTVYVMGINTTRDSIDLLLSGRRKSSNKSTAIHIHY